MQRMGDIPYATRTASLALGNVHKNRLRCGLQIAMYRHTASVIVRQMAMVCMTCDGNKGEER